MAIQLQQILAMECKLHNEHIDVNCGVVQLGNIKMKLKINKKSYNKFNLK